MIAVLFEVQVKEGKTIEYLNLAEELKPLLATMKGFISMERFQSLSNKDKVLSLSFWQDEAAIEQWRNLDKHRLAQEKGHDHLFKHYQLKVTQVMRECGQSPK